MSLPPLPIDPLLPEVVRSLTDHPCLVLRAPPGAGKTTRVPPALLQAGLAGSGRIVLLQPRRLAARAAAARLAEERGCPVGGEIGYHVRFERRAGRDTRILVVTDGIFLRLLADDPFLEGVNVVIFDEFHERNLDADVALAMTRRVQCDVRPEMKIVVMSATLAAAPVTKFLGGCPSLESEGRTFPVEIRYLRHALDAPPAIAAARGAAEVFAQTAGDVLVFLPGVGEIRHAEKELQAFAAAHDLAVMPLFGDMPLDEQQAVLRPGSRRKIVLATNVAETSVTIEGVTAVVDSGLARTWRLDPALGLNRRRTVRISRAAAEQRAGRAGRTSPGVCLRLWTEREHSGLIDFEPPEILCVDLAGPVLQLLAWGETDLERFGWFEPPPPEALEHARTLLRRLHTIDERGITELGRKMARLPVHPRIARLLLEGYRLGEPERIALVGAMLSERDPFRRGAAQSTTRTSEQGGGHWSDSDVLDRLIALEEFERHRQRQSAVGTLDAGAARFALRARDQLLRLLDESVDEPRKKTASLPPELTSDEVVLRSLWTGFPDRLARRREPGSPRGVMLGGRGVRLSPQSAVKEAELFVCVELEEVGRSEALVRLASVVRRSWLSAERLSSAVEVEFDPGRERVVAWQRTRFEDLLLDQAATSLPPGYDASALLAREAAARLDRSLRLDEAANRFLARVRFLRQHMPQLALPDFGDDVFVELLPWLSVGCQSFDELRRAPVVDALRARLSHEQLAALDREAPERMKVPSGRSVALEYEAGKPPVLAVKIQELFGLHETPRVAAGRVPVLLHLLGPNQRPQQVTSDLPSFWRSTYPVIRKELKRRYPKHAWPEDPLAAAPTR